MVCLTGFTLGIGAVVLVGGNCRVNELDSIILFDRLSEFLFSLDIVNPYKYVDSK
ncbi:hypothetical protein BFV94_2267 [Alteromonas macleodii]|uniref:Uncharacterized protein n=1 Tax=Alteromonas macleodii TaxID=28108 RepID=A0AB36FST7_ALTMA|nr:hypothetical protein BFV93_2262 [Alteromonas macleodii]OES31205.1 hypothetical protein BFV95_2269 [Alteromonas macleodii]OES31800.1 hypothetical protein BFV94_2267 [Alteromonas macleodii]